MKKAYKGFTLVELIIVIAVIGVLAAILIPVFADVIEKANAKSAYSDAKNATTNIIAELTDRTFGTMPDTVILVKKGERIYAFLYSASFSRVEESAGNPYDYDRSQTLTQQADTVYSALLSSGETRVAGQAQTDLANSILTDLAARGTLPAAAISDLISYLDYQPDELTFTWDYEITGVQPAQNTSAMAARRSATGDEYATIDEALSAVTADDEEIVLLRSVTLSQAASLTHPITLDGNGYMLTVSSELSGQAAVSTTGTISLKHIIINGNGSEIRLTENAAYLINAVSGGVEFKNTVLNGNSKCCVVNAATDLKLNNGTKIKGGIYNNSIRCAGVYVTNNADLTVNSCEFTANEPSDDIVIHLANAGNASINNSTVYSSKIAIQAVNSASMNISGSNITGRTYGIYLSATATSVSGDTTITGCNTGISVHSATCNVSGNTLISGSNTGIDAYSSSTLNVSGNAEIRNSSSHGIFVKGANLNMTGGTVTHNTGYGINWSGESCTMNISNAVISDNTTGGISCAPQTTIKNTTLSGNGKNANNSGAIVLYRTRTAVVENCTITGNTSKNGGAINMANGSNLTVRNCTISGNTATEKGGGIYAGDSVSGGGCTIQISGTTFTGNTAASGGNSVCVSFGATGGLSVNINGTEYAGDVNVDTDITA